MKKNTTTNDTTEGYGMNDDNLRFDERTQCYVRRAFYDFDARRGVLIMGDGSCTDMSGAISLFQGIDPEVQRIDTYAGEVPDTVYRKHSAKFGGWRAYLPARGRGGVAA